MEMEQKYKCQYIAICSSSLQYIYMTSLSWKWGKVRHKSSLYNALKIEMLLIRMFL